VTLVHVWVAMIVAAIVAGAGWAWRRRGRPFTERVLVALLPLALLATAVEVLPAVAALPISDVTALRVVPGVALATGHSIYAGPQDGPIIDFMYGPIGAVAYIPAALATSPSAAIAIAGAINAAAFFVPIGWLHRRLLGGLTGVAAMLAFVLLACRDGGLAYSGLTVHVDAPALGLATVAVGMLVVGRRNRTAHAVSAAALVLAAWTKQTVAPIVALLPLYVLAVEGKRAARSYLAWVIGFGIVASALLLVAFGPAPMFFSMVTVPSRVPWYGEPVVGTAAGTWPSTGGKMAGLWLSTHVFAEQQGLKIAALAALLVACARRAPSARTWLATEPWVLVLLVGVAQIPMAIVGAAKVGGYLNSHSMASYFLTAALTLATGKVALEARGNAGRVPLILLLAALLAAPLLRSDASDRMATTLADLRAWRQNPHERAYAYARAHPGEVYLPWDSLATLLAEGRLDSSAMGLWNRDLAGIVVSDELWRRYVPAHARYLAFRVPTGPLQSLPSPATRLPEYRERVELPEFPGWVVYRRETP
jgi:hypothetical protein